jgi:hypothetical protein
LMDILVLYLPRSCCFRSPFAAHWC